MALRTSLPAVQPSIWNCGHIISSAATIYWGFLILQEFGQRHYVMVDANQ